MNHFVRKLFTLLGAAGISIVIGGILLLYFNKEATNSVIAHLATGATLTFLGFLANFKRFYYYFKSHKGKALILSIFLLLLNTYIVLCINYISYQYRIRMDFTQINRYSVSEKTINILKTQINEPITFIVNEDIQQEALLDLKELTTQYEYHNKQIKTKFYNPLKNPSLAHSIQQFYQIKSSQLLVIANEIKGTAIEKSSLINENTNRLEWNKCEQAITNAILNTIDKKRKKIYFTIGHGEPSLNEKNLHNANLVQLKDWLVTDNFIVEELDLFKSDKAIPSDCDVLVTINPTRAFHPDEISKIDHYLKTINDEGKQGKYFAALGPNFKQEANGSLTWFDSGIESLLTKYGLLFDKHLLFEKELKVEKLGPFALSISPTYMAKHKISSPFIHEKQFVHWGNYTRNLLPLTVEQTPLVYMDIFQTSPDCKAINDINGFNKAAKRNLQNFLNERESKQHIIAMAIAQSIDQNKLQDELSIDPKGFKLVGIGNGSFLNSPITEIDRDLFVNSLRWLTEDYELIGKGTKISSNNKWLIKKENLNIYREIIFYLMPLFWIFIGGVVWWFRRS